MIIDLHCDTLMKLYTDKTYSLLDNCGHVDLKRLKEGGVGAQCFAIFVPTFAAASEGGITAEPYEYYKDCVRIFDEQMEKYSELIAPARRVSDIEKNAAEGKLSGILTVEDTVSLFGKIERVDEFYDDGVRMAALTWNYENSVGFPNTKDPEKMALGLKPFGIEAVRRMNELGIAVDVSHLSEGGFYDVAKYSSKPFAASHSCAGAICGHSRNLSDNQLRVLADNGGVAGVNFCAAFIREGSDRTAIDDIVRHMKHMKNIAGIGTIAMGSDFDGIGCGLEMGSCAGFPMLIDAMKKAFTDDEVDMICEKNALRFFGDVIGK